MQETKLKIDLHQGLLEVTGSENLVREIYDDFRDALKARPESAVHAKDAHGNKPSANPPAEKSSTAKSSTNSKSKTSTKPKAKKGASSTTGSLLKELNLMNEGSVESLRDFYARYEVKTNLERTLVFVYYLQHVRSISNIGIDHVFTCYRNIEGLKIPGHLKQNLLDTSSKKGWLDTSNMEDIRVPVTGVNYIEHDLPKQGTTN